MYYKQSVILKWAVAYLFFLASFLGVSAKNVNADEARAIAAQFMGLSNSRASVPMRLEYSALRYDVNEPAYYVFNTEGNNGFVVVAGDDAVSPILGYSLSSSFNAGDIPPALQWKLDRYRDEMSSLSAENVRILSRSVSKNPIEPLITTKWGQSAPYNRFTPTYVGIKCPTGCIATAVAQVMYYHRGTEKYIGSHTYELSGESFSYDYSNASFDWDNMRDVYLGVVVSDYEADAVANLMLACGIGVNMGYAGSVSGSDIMFVKRFLVENMGYNPEMAIRYKNNYNPKEWEELLYYELVNDRPIICQGGGHAYICDGYDGEGYFHFNWGWDGSYDSYFLPSLLNPTPEDNFHKDMYILSGVEGSKTDGIYWTPDLICKDEFKIDERGKAFLKVENHNSSDFKGKLGAKITSQDGVLAQWYEFEPDVEIEAGRMFGLWAGRVTYTLRGELPRNIGLETGKYVLDPGYRSEDGAWRELRCFVGCQSQILLEVTEDGQYIYSNPEKSETPTYEVCITNLRINDMAEQEELRGVTFAGNPPVLRLTYINHYEIACRPNLVFIFTKDGDVYSKENSSIVLEGLQVLNYSIQFGKGFEVGEYQLDIYDEYGRRVNDETLNFSVIPKPDSSGITSTVDDGWNENAPVEYFDMQGRRVTNPGRGIYIVRQGTLTRKVALN